MRKIVFFVILFCLGYFAVCGEESQAESSSAVSCVDCELPCPVPPPLPSISITWTIRGYSAVNFLVVLVVSICFCTVVSYYLLCTRNKGSEEEVEEVGSPSSTAAVYDSSGEDASKKNFTIPKKFLDLKKENKILKQQVERCNLLHGSPIVKKECILKYDGIGADKLIKGIVSQFTPSVARNCIQGTAAYLIFMALRYRDMNSDEFGVGDISIEAITHIEKIVNENKSDLDLCVLWLANTARLLHCTRQYPDSTYTRSNTKDQSKLSLRCDMSNYNKRLERNLNKIYSTILDTVQESLSKIIYPAIVKYDSVSLSSTPVTPNRRVNRKVQIEVDPKAAWGTLMDKLNQLNSLCNVFGVDPDIIAQLYKQLFYFISSEVLNALFKRKEVCNRATGVTIKHNISTLEQWIRDNAPQGSEEAASILKTLQPVINASQLFQARKTIEGVDDLVSSLHELTAPQILKLLPLSTPQGYEEVPSEFLPAVVRKLKEIRPASELDEVCWAKPFYDSPLNISYCPSTVDLETVQIPQGMSIPGHIILK